MELSMCLFDSKFFVANCIEVYGYKQSMLNIALYFVNRILWVVL